MAAASTGELVPFDLTLSTICCHTPDGGPAAPDASVTIIAMPMTRTALPSMSHSRRCLSYDFGAARIQISCTRWCTVHTACCRGP